MTNYEAQNMLEQMDAFNEITNYDLVSALFDAQEAFEKTDKRTEKVREPSENYKKYQEEAQKIFGEYSQKNEDDSPKTITRQISPKRSVQQFVFDESKTKERLKAIEELDKKYKKEIELQEKKNEEYVKMLNADSKFKKIEVKKKDIPKKVLDEIPFKVFRLLKKIIELV
jgi:hypothetical protein